MFRKQAVRGDVAVSERRVEFAPWSPAQLVALVVGGLFTVLGGLALAKTGLAFDNLAATHVQVAGFHHTSLLAVIELVFGVLMIGAGVIPGAGRGSMTFLGMVGLVLGLLMVIVPASLHESLGVHPANGWLWLVASVVTLVAAMAAPVFFGRGREAVATESDVARTGSTRTGTL